MLIIFLISVCNLILMICLLLTIHSIEKDNQQKILNLEATLKKDFKEFSIELKNLTIDASYKADFLEISQKLDKLANQKTSEYAKFSINLSAILAEISEIKKIKTQPPSLLQNVVSPNITNNDNNDKEKFSNLINRFCESSRFLNISEELDINAANLLKKIHNILISQPSTQTAIDILGEQKNKFFFHAKYFFVRYLQCRLCENGFIRCPKCMGSGGSGTIGETGMNLSICPCCGGAKFFECKRCLKRDITFFKAVEKYMLSLEEQAK